jgi:hypothetical protein
VFTTAPGADVVTVDMRFFFWVRFKDDSLDFEKFANQYWMIKKLTLMSLRSEAAPATLNLANAPALPFCAGARPGSFSRPRAPTAACTSAAAGFDPHRTVADIELHADGAGDLWQHSIGNPRRDVRRHDELWVSLYRAQSVLMPLVSTAAGSS